jgi:DNA-binding NtrC family response regulator/pSer/pThr/pTyr-binding forkhead associated (FHA) protein
MIELIFSRDGKPCLRQQISESSLTIGRDNDNHVQLTDEDISRKHLRIEWKDGKYIVTDFSRNGTYLNNQPVKTAALNVGDSLTIGRWTVNVVAARAASKETTVSAPRHPTSILNFDAEKKAVSMERVKLLITTPDQKKDAVTLKRTETVLGSQETCDVEINDSFVSRRHCRLIHKNGRIVLMDMGSTNGTYVEGIRIDNVSLPPEGTFRIGKTTIEYKLDRHLEIISPSLGASLGPMIGASETMREVFSLIERVAPSDATVLITGESGTGKDLAARLLHQLSHRVEKPFISVNCGAIPASIIESQLFGHEKGSFTGAVERMAGLIEQANGGTLFLDEIGEMPLELQTRLLNVLESKKVRRLGSKEETDVDFRLIAATNKDLQRLTNEGRFRKDLFFRLYVIPMNLCPLRERGDDLKILVSSFIKDLSAPGRKMELTPAAIEKLVSHSWPGNVRELKNVIQRAILLAPSNTIDADAVSFAPLEIPVPAEHNLEDKERDTIVTALRKFGGNQSKAAAELGIARTTLSAKVLKYRIDVKKMQN